MLGLDFKVCTVNCKKVVFTETTGTYTPANTTGWNTPNVDIDDTTSATLQIWDKDNNSLTTLDLFNTGLPDPNYPSTLNTFPNDSYQATAFNFYQGTISNTVLGLLAGDAISDGVYTYRYTVVADGITYVKTKYYFHFCTVKCCVDKQFAKIDPCCDCDQSELLKANRMNTLLGALEKAAECFQKERFARLLRILQSICNNNKCDCN